MFGQGANPYPRQVMLPWRLAAILAVGVGAAGLVARSRRGKWRSVAAYAQETALVLALYAVWQVGLDILVTGVGGAFPKARWIWHFEHTLHLPSEVRVQRWALPYPWLVKACNYFYALVDYPALIAFLIWLFVRYRARYRWGRNILVLSTGACMFVQAIPVAPPRLFANLGFVDTLALYHQSVYGPKGQADPGQLIAMPSVHVAWAVLIAVVVVCVSRSRWRWLILLHPAATVIAVVVTGNHWWLDGIVGALFVGAAAIVLSWRSSSRSSWRSSQPLDIQAVGLS
jgi:hypothetical protein